eukprot:1195600-Prorocentrum_minimum.AAC.7
MGVVAQWRVRPDALRVWGGGGLLRSEVTREGSGVKGSDKVDGGKSGHVPIPQDGNEEAGTKEEEEEEEEEEEKIDEALTALDLAQSMFDGMQAFTTGSLDKEAQTWGGKVTSAGLAMFLLLVLSM